MTDSKKASIVAKIRALLAKTTENGCSEQEAESATSMASKLMEEYDLEFKDIRDVEEEVYGKRARPFGGGSSRRKSFHEVVLVIAAIAHYFDCKVWYGRDLTFFGTKDDTEMAHAMTDMMKVAMETEWTKNKSRVAADNPNLHGKSLRTAFMNGMAWRISQRLKELKDTRSALSSHSVTLALPVGNSTTSPAPSAPSAPGTSLVVIKNQIVERKYQTYAKQNDLKLAKVTRTTKIRSKTAFERGAIAGEGVKIR